MYYLFKILAVFSTAGATNTEDSNSRKFWIVYTSVNSVISQLEKIILQRKPRTRTNSRPFIGYKQSLPIMK